jgi:hypothetical protein
VNDGNIGDVVALKKFPDGIGGMLLRDVPLDADAHALNNVALPPSLVEEVLGSTGFIEPVLGSKKVRRLLGNCLHLLAARHVPEALEVFWGRLKESRQASGQVLQ